MLAMLDFDAALSLVIHMGREAPRPGPERLALFQAAGRVLAEEVTSPIPLPAHDYSAMDGYAVLAADVGEAGVRLPVVGECQTGHEGVSVLPGQCARIFTGARIPPGADTVVMQENVNRVGDDAVFSEAAVQGAHIRRAGEDLSQGQTVLLPGTRLSPFHLGLLASVERTEVLVARKPRVVIVCTGDELRPAGALYQSGHLAESNSIVLAALAQQVGGEPIVAPLAKDTQGATEQAIADALHGADIVLTVGGVSVGDHDVVEPALRALGARIIFHKVGIKPGKPILLAEKDGKFIVGLPGNPSSAQVTFSLFGAPLVRLLQGDSTPIAPQRTAKLRSEFRQKPGRRGFYRARLEGNEVDVYWNQASGASTSMAWANCFVVLEEETTAVNAGEEVAVIAYTEL